MASTAFVRRAALGAVMLAPIVFVGAPSAPELLHAAAQEFSVSTTNVTVDVVVRDKRGRLVTDLHASDFLLSEDGVAQTIRSVELLKSPGADDLGRGIAAKNAPTAVSDPKTNAGEPAGQGADLRFTALLFDRLDSESMSIARAGAEAAVAEAGQSNVIAVFTVDGGLRLIQGFSADKQRLSSAVATAVQHATAMVTRDKEGRRHDGGGSRGPIAGADVRESPVVEVGLPKEMVEVMRRSSDMLERQFQGHASTDALLTAVAALSTLPGRKTLMYFSDVLAMPDASFPRIDDIVATANRGHVTIYAVDTAGLRVGSQDAATRTEVMKMGNAGLEVTADGGNSSTLAMMERNEEVLRRSPRAGFALLARPTGGLVIENTNDLAGAVRRIEADSRSYYLISYSPLRADLDGQWRKVEVKVRGRDLLVQARQGYLAVRSPGRLPVLLYEGPALAAADRAPQPDDLPVATAAFAFPRPSSPADAAQDLAVVVAAPAARLTFQPRGATFATDFTMLALIRGIDGIPLQKTSQPFRLARPVGQLADARAGDARFVRLLAAGPGVYDVQGVVYDQASSRSGAATARIEVPKRGGTGLGISSLVILQSFERESDETRTRVDLLSVPPLVVKPYVYAHDRLSRQPGAKLTFLFTVVDAQPNERLATRIQIAASGPGDKVEADARVMLEPADATGRTMCVGQLPLDQLPDGEFELRAIVSRAADKSETRVARFRLSS